MNEKFQTLVHGAVLAVIIGWVLYVGKSVFVPIVLGILVVYVIIGLAKLLHRVRLFGRALPPRLCNAASVLVIAVGLVELLSLISAAKNSIAALAPQYQETMLASIQRIAAFLRIETEPTWTTLREDLLAQVNVQSLVGSLAASVGSIFLTIVVVLLYASFLMVEQRSFAGKIAYLSDNPDVVARVRKITTDINARIGSYLALKTLVSILLGALSWIVMAWVGLEFAVFWGVLIALLNYAPYIGSFFGVLLPVLMAIAQFGSVNDILAVLLPLVAIQFVIGNFLDPWLMGNSLNLSPFAILVSLAVWSELWGIPGAFLAVPITAIMAIVLSQFDGSRPIAVLLSRDGRL